jgi:hypothetical protein
MPVAGLRRMPQQYQGGLGRRRRYADGGDLRAGGPQPEAPPPPPAAEPGPDEILARIEAMGGSTQMLPALLNGNGDQWVDDSGRGLIGAPDENGMAALPLDAQGNWMPRQFGAGPPYTESLDPYLGGPPMNPGVWMGSDSGDGRSGGDGSGPPPGALDFSGGDGIPSNWKDYDTGNTSTGGGFFNFARLFGSQGREVPDAFKSGANLPSTNNYRLLLPQYQHPNYIMRNGQVIDMNSPQVYGPAGEAYSMDWYGGRWRSGAGAGVPAAYAAGPVSPNIVGWPGQLGPYGQSSTAGS